MNDQGKYKERTSLFGETEIEQSLNNLKKKTNNNNKRERCQKNYTLSQTVRVWWMSVYDSFRLEIPTTFLSW